VSFLQADIRSYMYIMLPQLPRSHSTTANGLVFRRWATQDVEKTSANQTLTAMVTETRQKASITVNTPKMR